MPSHDRLYDRDRPGDQRTQAQRDRDRILYTSAFRRLAGVTQVVAASEGQIFHNRLTHTLEVAQVGRRVAEFLHQRAPELAAHYDIDPDRVEASCLAHDLGHPPFGHIGEQKLNELLLDQGDEDGFEGNAQSFRIVTRLATRHADFLGLNLMRGTLNAILKYPWLKGRRGKKARKYGAYRADQEVFEWTRAEDRGDQRSAEAEVMDWADDVTYAVHDVEDFYRAGLIPLDKLIVDEDESWRFLVWVVERWKREGRRETFEECSDVFNKLVRSSMPLTEIYRGTRSQRAALRTVTAFLIGRYIGAITLLEPRRRSVRARVDPGARLETDLLKQLPWYYVIENPALATQQYGQQAVLDDLFGIYCEAASSGRTDIFPTRHREALEGIRDLKENPAMYRTVVDMLAGLSEAECLSLHARLTGASPGSVTDAAIR